MKGFIMANEISLVFLFKILKSAWWKILIITVAVVLLVAGITQFLIPKKYASTVQFYIINASATTEYTTSALLSAAEYLANDYIKIINGDRMIQTITDDLAKNSYTATPGAIRSMISSSTSAESSMFEITVTHKDKAIAYLVADSIERNAPSIIKEISKPAYASNLYIKTDDGYKEITANELDCIVVICAPAIATTHVSPSLITNCLLAAVIAICLSYVLFLLIKLFDTTIRTETNAKELVDLPIIGDIPTWNQPDAEKDGQKD